MSLVNHYAKRPAMIALAIIVGSTIYTYVYCNSFLVLWAQGLF